MRTMAAFVASLGILIFIHEFGHFLAAKLFGVTVERFSLGFGPRLFGKQLGETDYRISAFPLGGYVKMLGESADEEIPPHLRPRSFAYQKLRRRMAIVAAGPGSNFLLAFLLYTLTFAFFGLARTTTDVGEVTPDSPAAHAGLRPGDTIVAINSTPVHEWGELSELIQKSGTEPIRIRLKRHNEFLSVVVTPRLTKTKTIFGEEVSRPLIGIVASSKVTVQKVGPLRAIVYGADQTWQVTRLTFVVIGKLIKGAISPRTLAGPIGIAQMSGKVAEAGPVAFLSFLSLLSINLAILNLLPIPVLDGGHLLFFTIEGVMGKPLSMKKREVAQQVGLFLLIALMVFVFYNDIYRLVYPGKALP
ncbi:MAG: RIP metalloprotease RseP [Deltaproteobacteria bacterium]|nr:RIP metalloprotease RseP [Deltaproteobacteria bacterium]MBW2071454.1 RIP metalloprotease RseP [Deltaproteobacteria bacterium]